MYYICYVYCKISCLDALCVTTRHFCYTICLCMFTVALRDRLGIFIQINDQCNPKQKMCIYVLNPAFDRISYWLQINQTNQCICLFVFRTPLVFLFSSMSCFKCVIPRLFKSYYTVYVLLSIEGCMLIYSDVTSKSFGL